MPNKNARLLSSEPSEPARPAEPICSKCGEPVVPWRDHIHTARPADAALLCGAGCGCRVGTEDSDRVDCGCDGPCCWDTWDDWIGDVLNRPDYYDEMRVARGMPSALAASQPTAGEEER